MSLIDLTKKAKITLEKKGISSEKVKVILALDISLSMSGMYNSGLVQNVVERILGIGMNMSETESVDIYLFGRNSFKAQSVDSSNIDNYVKRDIVDSFSLESSTFYAGVMEDIMKDVNEDYGNLSNKSVGSKDTGFFRRLFKLDKEEEVVSDEIEDKEPVLVFFISDGDNFDKGQTEKLIKEVSKYSVFWQFVGIGNSNFSFLEKLDDMGGRVMDNANFFKLNDISRISDEELYDRILNEFPSWLKESRSKGITN